MQSIKITTSSWKLKRMIHHGMQVLYSIKRETEWRMKTIHVHPKQPFQVICMNPCTNRRFSTIANHINLINLKMSKTQVENFPMMKPPYTNLLPQVTYHLWNTYNPGAVKIVNPLNQLACCRQRSKTFYLRAKMWKTDELKDC